MAKTDKIDSEIIGIYKSMPRDEKCKDLFCPIIFDIWASYEFEKEAKAIFSETKNEEVAWEQPDFHYIFVPEVARWANLSRTKRQIGYHLIDAFKELEKCNEFLDGVFSPIENQIYAIKEDGKLENEYLRLMQNLSFITMTNTDIKEGQFQSVFDKILSYVIEDCRSGDYSTPSSISKLISSIVDPKDSMTILDPFCGAGGLLLECERYVNEHKNGHLSLFGQEINENIWMYCKLKLTMNGCRDAIIKNDDSISNPAFIDDGSLKQFDRVVSVPPFGLKMWGYEIAEYDKYSRFRYGIPPKNSGDFAFLQHIIACLNENGKGAMVSPQGILFRSGSESQIRKNIVQSDVIEAIIVLPSRLFSYTGINVIVTVINMNKPEERRGSIIFISAEREYEETKRQNILSDENIAKIVDAYKNYKDIEKFCRVVNLEEIRDNDYSLNFSLYVDTESEIETVDITQTLQKISNLKNEREELFEEITGILRKFDQNE